MPAVPVFAAKLMAYLIKMGITKVLAKQVATKTAGLAVKAYKSKYFLSGALGAGLVGQTVLTEKGRAGERKMAREQIEIENLLRGKAEGAAERMVGESKANTAKYIKEITKTREAEATQAREDMMMQSFMEGQDRQMAMSMQAIAGMSNRPSSAPQSSGMLSTMRRPS